MQRGIIILRQVHFQAYRFDCLVDRTRLKTKLIGNRLMHSDRWKRQVRFVGGLDLRQFFAIALVGLHFPPAWNTLPVAQFFDDLLDGFLGYTQLFRDLRANTVKLGRRCQLQVAFLNLFDLLFGWYKRFRWRNLLTFWLRWRGRPRLLDFLFWPPAPIATFQRLARSLPNSASYTGTANSIASRPAILAVTTRPTIAAVISIPSWPAIFSIPSWPSITPLAIPS